MDTNRRTGITSDTKITNAATMYGAAIRTAPTDDARDAAICTAILNNFGITATARVLGVPRGTLQKRAHRLGLVYDKETGKWMG